MNKAELIKSLAELADTCEIALDKQENRIVASRVLKNIEGKQVLVLYSYEPNLDNEISLPTVA